LPRELDSTVRLSAITLMVVYGNFPEDTYARESLLLITLCFTHYWGRSRRGNWVVQRKTASTRFSRALKRISVWCRQHRHAQVAWKHQQLVVKLRGHYTYYGITGNLETLRTFRRAVTRVWRKWLQRRSQRHRLDWERYNRLLVHYPLPKATIVHAAAKT
jgi:RNA-directed DNA polymerase